MFGDPRSGCLAIVVLCIFAATVSGQEAAIYRLAGEVRVRPCPVAPCLESNAARAKHEMAERYRP